ncbi:phage tail domain-containing protein [Jeotgalicoccus halotolerans]|uniref:phage tail domain-containing protein n=1 Tax=Jeotgalicoccus halotolerans TaxID=157227 RepID=UPI00351711D4
MPKDNFGLGLEGLDLFFSSIGRNVSDEHRTHVTDGPRSANIRAYIKSMSRQDYKLKRNRVYSFFRQLGDFYVADIDEPNKLLKVSVDTEFTPNWLDGVNHAAEMDIPLSIVGQPYRISRHTSLELQGLKRDGKWSRGMHLRRDDAYNQYVFNNVTDISVYNPSDIDLYIKQHLDFKIKFECLQSMSRISLLDEDSNEFIFTDALKTGDIVEIEGHRIKKNGQLSAAKFNDVYPILKGGYSEVYQEYSMNKIKVSTGLKVTFDFRPKYD